MNTYFGKYRGKVTNNVDPMKIGRIQASVPDVGNGKTTSWAMPCVPLAGKSSGTYLVPAVGSGVWIEFEQGNPDYPIWTGCFWGTSAEVPKPASQGNPANPSIVLETVQQNMIVISDVPGPKGGITLKIASGASIEINSTGITIKNGQGASISLKGTSVKINDTALVVT